LKIIIAGAIISAIIVSIGALLIVSGIQK